MKKLNDDILESAKEVEEFSEEIFESFFEEYRSFAFYNAFLKDDKCKKLINEKEEILNKNPKIRNILENETISSLTKEETKTLIEIQKLNFDIRRREEMNLLRFGIETGYFLIGKLVYKKEDLNDSK